MKKKLYFLLFPLIFAGQLLAQKSETPVQFWVTGGVGQSLSDAFSKNPGLVAGTGFSLSKKQQLASLQLNHSWETGKGDKMQGDFNEWKIQYGWIRTKSRDQFYATGGLSYTECNHFRVIYHGDGMSVQKDWTTDTAFGFVIESGLNYVINEHIGIGFASFANFNKNALTAGYRVNILLGLFKKNYQK